MGLIFGKTMEAQFQKQQDFMIEMNRITLERQIQMQNQMRERMMAAQVARARELFVWLGSFYAISAVAMIAGLSDDLHRISFIQYLTNPLEKNASSCSRSFSELV